MTPHPFLLPTLPTLADTPTAQIAAALAGPGLWLDIGLVTLRVRSDAPALAAQLQSVYRHFPLQTAGDWADLHIDLWRPCSPRRWLRPQVVFHCDGVAPFDPFPADTALPLLEWGANWLIGRRCNDHLLFHAGVVERDGHALLMPALPGSGKSTLTAALSQRGWRLLSDEFGAYDWRQGHFVPALKPVALKNESIEVIRRFGCRVDASTAQAAELGPSFPKTRKGTVAHLAPSAAAVRGVHTPAWPGAIVLPRWQAGASTTLQPVQPAMAFSSLAFNAFNYTVCAADGFDAAVALIDAVPAWQLIYRDLDDALRTLAGEWPAVAARAQARRADLRRDADALLPAALTPRTAPITAPITTSVAAPSSTPADPAATAAALAAAGLDR